MPGSVLARGSELFKVNVSLANQAYSALERRIVVDELSPGALLSEQALSREVGVGRTPIREALQRLARDGLVRVVARRGAIVQDLGLSQYRYAAEVRREIDPFLWREAALGTRRTERAELAEIAAELDAPTSGRDSERVLRLDARSRQIVSATCGCRLLVPALPALQAVSRRIVVRGANARAGVLRATAEALRAVARGDAAAAEQGCRLAQDALDALAADVFRGSPTSPWPGPHEKGGGPGLSERAFREIENRLVAGRLRPGELLSEMRLSEELGIGRTPVREALQRLAFYRLVRIEPRRGAIVAEDRDEDLRTLFDARHLLERLLSRLAATRSDDQDRRRMREIATAWVAAARSGATPEIITLDEQAKDLLRRVARNPFLASAHAPIHALARRLYFRHLRTEPDVEVASAQAELLQAIASGDETAAALASDRCLAESRRAIMKASARP